MSEDELKKYHHFIIKTSDGIELDLIETKYYEELLDLYKQEKEKAKEYRIGWCNTGEELEQEKEKNKELDNENKKLSEEIIENICKGAEEDVLEEYRQQVKNSISKDKIREKIKSLEEKIHIVIPNEYNKIEVMNEFKNEGAVGVLKELLEED